LLRWVDKHGPVDTTKTVTAPPASLHRDLALEPASLNGDGSVLATEHLTVQFGGLTAVDGVEFRAMPGEVVGLIGNNGAGKSTLLNAIGGYVPAKGTVQLLGHDVSSKKAYQRARRGLGRTFQSAALPRADGDTVQPARADSTSFRGSLWVPSIRPERKKYAEAGELIGFRAGRCADRYVADSRRALGGSELATVLLMRRLPRQPTAGIAQRSGGVRAVDPRVQQELDAT
jgi:ABC-type glutathione transport system ATPase component